MRLAPSFATIPIVSDFDSSTAPRAISFGKYLLLERLHSGPASEVFLAKTFGVEGFQKFVAVKRMRTASSNDDAAVTRFIEQAKLLGGLSHAHITPVYELGKVGPLHYMVMEHVWGQSLRTLIARRGSKTNPPAAMAAFIGARMCEALQYAHSRRREGAPAPVFHGDIEPANILVSYEGTIKLTDFAYPGAGSDADALLDGRYAYRSPEQLAGAPVDAKCDIFGVAACVYELLTGESPERAADTGPRFTPENDGVARQLEELLVQSLSRDRRRRPETAADLQASLMRILGAGHQPFTTSRAAEWMRDEFEETLERAKRRMNLYANVTSPGDVESLRPHPMDDDPFANEPTVITESPVEDAVGGGWDDAPTQIYFSSEGLTTGESAALFPTKTPSMTVKLADDALEPSGSEAPTDAHEPEERAIRSTGYPGDGRSKRSKAKAKAKEASSPERKEDDPKESSGVSRGWYIAAGIAAIVVFGIGWGLTQSGAEGQIEIRERNGRPAEAWLDGVHRGETPLRLEQVRVGRRLVELRADGETLASLEVRVRPDVTALVELSITGEADTNADEPGRLILTTVPWAYVHLDGRPTGRRTPLPELTVSPGRHLLRLVTDDGRSIEEEVFVRPGESVRIVRRFE